ncbi:hypothetical protein [Roseovarius sp. 2305UL8-3]|uniref:hypothetical protein n=1 Tax=Roseovarius conchicola TaxID=3121636 RepID=UPI003527D66E
MFNPRPFGVLLAALLLCGCMNTQLLEEGAANTFNVRDVSVDTVQLKKGVRGRVNEISPSKVARDIDANLTNKLRARSRGETPVDLKVSITSVNLVSPGQSFLVGGVSTIMGIINVTDARTGELVLEPTQIAGTAKGNYAPGGLIGVALTKQVDDDYRSTVAGFVSDVERLLFGDADKTSNSTTQTTTEASQSNATQSSDRDAAIRRAELRAERKYRTHCARLACEQAVARAGKEAAEAYDKEAAQNSN